METMTVKMGGNYYHFNPGDKFKWQLLTKRLESVDFIFWDSGFFIRLMNSAKPQPNDVLMCKAFHQLLRDSNDTISVTCDFVLEEVANHFISRFYDIERIKINKKEPDKYLNWTSLYKDHPELITNAIPFLDSMMEIIDKTPVFIHRAETDVEKNALSLIKKYNLCAMDAFILATMLDAGIEDIITTDVRDLKIVKESDLINIYSCYRIAG